MANPHRHFQATDPATLHGLVAAQPLATLVVSHQGALQVNHVPLYLDPAQVYVFGADGGLLQAPARKSD